MNSAEAICLAVEGLSKTFGDVVALHDVDFELERGSLVALLGSNGAGKSTLLKVLGGRCIASSGSMYIQGRQYQPNSVQDALAKGISTIHQELSLIDEWTVWEHFISALGERFVNASRTKQVARENLGRLGLDIPIETKTKQLNTEDRQLLELAKAMSLQPEILLVDEPTAGLTQEKRLVVFNTLKTVAQQGTTVLLATHDIHKALKTCPRLLFLDRGRLVYDGSSQDYVPDSDIITPDISEHRLITDSRQSIYLSYYRKDRPAATQSLKLSTGSIIGVAAHPLSPYRDLLRAIAGLPSEISVSFPTKNTIFNAGNGIAYMSRERSTEWLCASHSIARNINLSSFTRLSRGLFMDHANEYRNAAEYAAKVGLKFNNLQDSIHSLSGGNKQRVVLSRCLSSKPRLLLLDEPYSGIDQQSRKSLYLLLQKFVAQGRAVLVYSEEYADLAAFCNQVLIYPIEQDTPLILSDDAISESQIFNSIQFDQMKLLETEGN